MYVEGNCITRTRSVLVNLHQLDGYRLEAQV